jgi:hypothetical protein
MTAAQIDAVPAELVAADRWLAWRYEERTDKDGRKKLTKVPVRCDNPKRQASSTDPTTWTTFAAALAVAEEDGVDGPGFVLGGGYAGVDLDGCRHPTTGSIHPAAFRVIAKLDSYTEISPSGCGVKVFCRGTLPEGRRAQPDVTWKGYLAGVVPPEDEKYELAMFATAKYFTVTGQHLEFTPADLEERTDKLADLHACVFPPEPATNGARPHDPTPVDLDDGALIERAMAAANGTKFRALWNGDIGGYASHSEADQALCNLLAFWAGADGSRMDALFRQSGLMRDKWERADYRKRTIDRAIESCREFYSPHAGRDEYRPPQAVANLSTMVDTAPDSERVAIEQTLDTFAHWLHLPDLTPVLAVLGAVAANKLPGDPVWLGIVAPPSSAKTEILNALSMLPDIYPTATLTPASLLSGTAKREKAADAKGGLLRAIGAFGILVMKDFGSVLSMRPDAKAEILAALRELYDGSWTRHLGTDGGRTLHWEGKVGLVFGATPALDSHHSVIGAMGERFLNVRMEAGGCEQARSALLHAGAQTATMRRELAEAVAALFAGSGSEPRALNDAEADELINLASLAVRIRSTVERDRQSREIESVHGAEGPARLALTLERLLAGLDALGVDRTRAFDVVRRVAMDSVPPLRRRALDWLQVQELPSATSAVATALDLPTSTTRRVLEDLAAYQLIERHSEGQGRADLWAARGTP